jgi:hypothetical protein
MLADIETLPDATRQPDTELTPLISFAALNATASVRHAGTVGAKIPNVVGTFSFECKS